MTVNQNQIRGFNLASEEEAKLVDFNAGELVTILGRENTYQTRETQVHASDIALNNGRFLHDITAGGAIDIDSAAMVLALDAELGGTDWHTGGSGLTNQQVVDAVTASLGGTAWKGKNGAPPEASFTLDSNLGDAPFTPVLTDTSTAGDNTIVSRVLSFDDGRQDIVLTGSTASFTLNNIDLTVAVTLTVTDEVGNFDTTTTNVHTTSQFANIPPVISNQSLTVEENQDLVITLGDLTDADGDTLTYTVTGSSDFSTGPGTNKITFNSASTGIQNLNVGVDDGNGGTDSAIVSVNVIAQGSITYPVIGKPSDQIVALNGTLNVSPTLTNPGSAGTVMWFKEYGHDDIVVNPLTGEVTWDTTGLISESFHVGLRCVNNDGIGYTNFIVHVGKTSGQIKYVGSGESAVTWADIYSTINPGDTVVLRDGTYRTASNIIGRDNDAGIDRYPPSGNAGTITCVMADNPGEAIFDDGISGVKFNLWSGGKNESSYIAFKGLFFEGGSVLSLAGDPNDKTNTRIDHMKVIMCGGAGEDDIPLYCRIADNVLFESCYSFGGGRYKISSNEATNVVYRRNVARYDRSDRKVAQDPKGSHILYNTMNFRMDNCIAVDDIDLYVNSGYKAGAFGTPVTSTSVTPEGSRGYTSRCIHLNSEQLVHQYDYQVSNGGGASDVETRDMVSYDCRPHGIFIYTWGFNLWDRCTFAKVRAQHPQVSSMVHTGGYNNFRGFRQCIFDDMPAVDNSDYLVGNVTVGDIGVPYNGGTSRTVTKYGLVNNNITNAVGVTPINSGTQSESGTTSVNITPDLKYVPRLERSSTISDTHGAEVMHLKGKSGTWHGEAGYDDDLDIPMWPFPAEKLIKDKMSAYTWTGSTYSGSDYLNRVEGSSGTIDGTRGFCVSGESLTGYVWGYIGNTVPPMGISAVPGDAQATVLWEPLSGIHATNITGYTIYDYDPDTGALSNGRAAAADADRIIIPSLINGFNSWFAVTATDSVKGESSYSYPVLVRPNGTPTVLPQIDTHPQNTSIIAGDTFTLTSDIQGYDSLQWQKDGTDIPGATGLNYTTTGQDADNGVTYTIVATNAVGSVSSTGAVLTVTPLDSTPPTVSIALNTDTLNITVSDNIYANSDLTMQLLDGGSPVGSTFAGSVTSIDLTTYPLATGSRTLSVRATDPQNNTGTSTTVQYTVGSPVFSDDFSDTSNWSGDLTVSGNVGTLGATPIRGLVNWWNADTKGSVKFDMKVNTQANAYAAYPRIRLGINTDGSKAGTLDIFCYPRTYSSNGWVDYIDRAGSTTTLTGKPTGFGNPDDSTSEWRTYEIGMVGTTAYMKVDDVELFSSTIPEDINPFSGTLQIDADAAGDLEIRNLFAYS